MSRLQEKFKSSICLLALVFCGCTSPEPEPSGFVIVNARVIDGSGGPAQDVNVRVEGDRIAAVGTFEPPASDAVIDAAGLVLAPGFVDTHSHHEYQLQEMPEALALVSQGVTTIVAGMDGGQEYPLADFYARLEASPAAVNVASYAGFGELRGRVLGEDYKRHATAEEIAAIAELFRSELHAGALGLATGLEYVPGSYSSTEELVELAKVSSAAGGRYLSHIRSEDQYFWDALEEAILIGREARLPVRISHIKLAMPRWWGQADRLKSRLDQARDEGVDISADIYPYRAWNSNFGWLQTLFPERDLSRAEGARYILEEMLSAEGILLPDFPPEPAYSGKTVAEIAALRDADAESTLMYLLQADAAAGAEVSMIGFAMDEPDIESIMAWPHAVIGSDGELRGPHPRGYGTFTRFLGHYVRSRNVVTLETAIRKISALPAEQVGILERGRIGVGLYADLVLFDPETVTDEATFESPHLPSTGISKVWVNGQLVFDEGHVTGARPGMVVRRVSDSE